VGVRVVGLIVEGDLVFVVGLLVGVLVVTVGELVGLWVGLTATTPLGTTPMVVVVLDTNLLDTCDNLALSKEGKLCAE
jgi:hypothetical protein